MRNGQSVGPGVGADSGFRGQIIGQFASDRMTPIRRDFSQRTDDEQPLGGARVRQCQAGLIQHRTAVGDEIQIESPRRIGRSAAAAEIDLYAAQNGQGFGWR